MGKSKMRYWALCPIWAAFGCATSTIPYKTPDHWSKADAYGAPSVDAYRPPTENISSTPPDSAYEHVRAVPVPRTPSVVGQACHTEMHARGLQYKVLPHLKGVTDPVEISGPVGGVQFYANDGRPLQLDCRLALALDDLGETLKSFGIRKVRYSGAYVYRTTRSGRLSHHAHGLAIDLHDFETNSKTLTVKHDFKRNAGCDRAAPQLNALSCDMRKQALFEEFLTPDFNADHHDHLHISVPRSVSLTKISSL